jgi:hypothetical protein
VLPRSPDLDDLALHAEDLLDELGGDHFGGCALGDDPSLAQRDEVSRIPGGLVEVVQYGDERPLLRLVQLREQVEHFQLVLDVKERRGLVEQQQRGLLGRRHRDPYALPLPAGQFVDTALRQFTGAGRCHRLIDSPLVPRATTGAAALDAGSGRARRGPRP